MANPPNPPGMEPRYFRIIRGRRHKILPFHTLHTLHTLH
jgi:hypothetical protein